MREISLKQLQAMEAAPNFDNRRAHAASLPSAWITIFATGRSSAFLTTR